MIIKRTRFLERLDAQFKTHRITLLLGPKQCGKTTLAHQYAPLNPTENYFDLDNPKDRERLANPYLALEPLSGLIILDEIQHQPQLFKHLKQCHDAFPHQQYLLIGNSAYEHLYQSSHDGAERIGYVELTPFTLEEAHDYTKRWYRGGFPSSYLQDEEQSQQWRRGYMKTFLEQDLPNLGFSIPAQKLSHFWHLLIHYHGQVLNLSDLGRSLDTSHVSIKKYINLLTNTFMIHCLQPWYEKKTEKKTNQNTQDLYP